MAVLLASERLVAVIVASPLFSALTSPLSLTFTISGLSLSHLTAFDASSGVVTIFSCFASSVCSERVLGSIEMDSSLVSVTVKEICTWALSLYFEWQENVFSPFFRAVIL